jgi:Cdc6-like AAA superfamily ATPase
VNIRSGISFLNSSSGIKEKWIKDHMGDTAESVVQYININSEELNNKLAFMTKIITDFYQLNLFSTDKRTNQHYRILLVFQ